MVAKRAKSINNHKVKKFFQYIFLFVFCSLVSVGAKAQALLAEEVTIQRQMEEVKTIALRNMLLNEVNTVPSADMYPEWVNTRVHFKHALPDSFRIDLRGFVMPTTNTQITDKFGYRPRRRRVHNGLDIKVNRGDTIYAAFDGKVRITAYQRKGYGHYVVVRHHNGIETLYAHLSKKLVGANDNVKAGDPIGIGGNTGRSSGPHLHFETLLLGSCLDPALLFDFKNQDVTGDFYLYRRPGSKYIENGVVKIAGPEKKYHKVKSGETIGKIARKYNVEEGIIFKLNKLNSRSIIRPGQMLRYQ
ncbi:MAG: peptidoglycan DD-metalloendopeptidase family protein [Bacteroidaceae bacterium]|nr:peptidoglycan DD-metalloendopeptidase family protein [Bacteroidaceae bacterium]